MSVVLTRPPRSPLRPYESRSKLETRPASLLATILPPVRPVNNELTPTAPRTLLTSTVAPSTPCVEEHPTAIPSPLHLLTVGTPEIDTSVLLTSPQYSHTLAESITDEIPSHAPFAHHRRPTPPQNRLACRPVIVPLPMSDLDRILMPHSSVSRTKLLAAVSTTRTGDLQNNLAAEELPPQGSSEATDQAAEEDADEWSLFTPRIPISPPSHIPSLAQTTPTDESSLQPSPKIGDLSNDESKSATTLPLIDSNVRPTTGSALSEQPRTSGHCVVKREREYDTGDEHDHHPCKRPRARRTVPLPRKYVFVHRCPILKILPFDDSTGQSNSHPVFACPIPSAEPSRLSQYSPICTDPCSALLVARDESFRIDDLSPQSFPKALDHAPPPAFAPPPARSIISIPTLDHSPSPSTVHRCLEPPGFYTPTPVALPDRSDVPLTHPAIPSLVLSLPLVPQSVASPPLAALSIDADLLGSTSASILTLSPHFSALSSLLPRSSLSSQSRFLPTMPSPDSPLLLNDTAQPPPFVVEDKGSKRGVKTSQVSVSTSVSTLSNTSSTRLDQHLPLLHQPTTHTPSNSHGIQTKSPRRHIFG
ncbi:hypothetical protein EDB92DRAFT_1960642 [Lactarius akahatsu]|uniref:Uncharacterized protein n=1 Tax=Lactarius akahatsu TaxID=416441 RepID=A0AAD4L3Y8_9AGAM|nr:hypothetical protein EDB92DRAFT_1960642 [Lactarius akahatsu]